jgi:hypothetical protein
VLTDDAAWTGEQCGASPVQCGEQWRTIVAGANKREAHLRALAEQLQFSVEKHGRQ